MKLECSQQNFNNAQSPSFIKTRPMLAELFHADEQSDGRINRQIDRDTDRYDEVNILFSQFCKHPPKSKPICLIMLFYSKMQNINDVSYH
jgi:hypothetical protein